MNIDKQVSPDGKVLTIVVGDKFDFARVQEFKQAYEGEQLSVTEVRIDLEKTQYMDSSALGMLLNMQKVMSSHVDEFKIINCQPVVAKVLKISRFDRKFTIL